MKYEDKCIDCAKQQGKRIYNLSLDFLKKNPNRTEETALLSTLDNHLAAANPDISPAELSWIAIQAAQNQAGCSDPFQTIKKENNQLALSLVPELRIRLQEAKDPLYLACQLAACGNIIDLGIHESFDIQATIDKVLRDDFRLNAYPNFCIALKKTNQKQGNLLFFCDNAGEIVFDRLLIEEILNGYPDIKVTAVVREQPILNDATLADAKQTDLTKLVPVITTGKPDLGVVISRTDENFQQRFNNADIILSKGQANYETLSHQPEAIFFILKAKCEVIARSLGVQLYDAVFTQSPFSS